MWLVVRAQSTNSLQVIATLRVVALNLVVVFVVTGMMMMMMMGHGALSILAVHGAGVLHAKQVCFKVLFWVDTGAEVTGTEDWIVITREDHTVDVDFTLAEAQSVLGRERTLVYVANRDASLVPADSSSARHPSKAHELSLDDVTVVVDAKDVLSGVLAVLTLTHLRGHLLSRRGHTVIPDAGNAAVGLSQCAVTLVAE